MMEEKAKLRLVSRREEGPYVSVLYYVRWECPDGTVRRPEETETVFDYPGAFTAGGREYESWRELCQRKRDAGGFLDRYGREVQAEYERFPCFDSFDLLYEDRYYRRFFLREGDSLTRVYYEDESKIIRVTRDVDRLTKQEWKLLKEAGWEDQ